MSDRLADAPAQIELNFNLPRLPVPIFQSAPKVVIYIRLCSRVATHALGAIHRPKIRETGTLKLRAHTVSTHENCKRARASVYVNEQTSIDMGIDRSADDY